MLGGRICRQCSKNIYKNDKYYNYYCCDSCSDISYYNNPFLNLYCIECKNYTIHKHDYHMTKCMNCMKCNFCDSNPDKQCTLCEKLICNQCIIKVCGKYGDYCVECSKCYICKNKAFGSCNTCNKFVCLMHKFGNDDILCDNCYDSIDIKTCITCDEPLLYKPRIYDSLKCQKCQKSNNNKCMKCNNKLYAFEYCNTCQISRCKKCYKTHGKCDICENITMCNEDYCIIHKISTESDL